MDHISPNTTGIEPADERAAAQSARLVLADLVATRRFAARLATLLKPGDLVTLAGDLGTGKSELARAIIRSLAAAEIEVPSPSFMLIQHYALPAFALAHADLYRLSTPDEVNELGLEEVLEKGVLLVEWPERAGDRLPADRLDLLLSFLPNRGEEARLLELRAGGSWRERLATLLAEGADG